MKRLANLGSKKVERGQYSLSTLATALEQAAEEGSLALAEAYLGFGADPNFSYKGSKFLRHGALEIAASKGHTQVVDYLVLCGADQIAVNDALVHSTTAGHAALSTRLIMTHNADVNASACLSNNLLPEKGPKTIVAFMAYQNVLSSSSKILDERQRTQFIKLLISKGCDVNDIQWVVYKTEEKPDRKKTRKEKIMGDDTRIGFGYSPLGILAPLCSESVKLLLKAGATVYLAPQRPAKDAMNSLRQHNFACSAFSTVQPISCFTVERWRADSTQCVRSARPAWIGHFPK